MIMRRTYPCGIILLSERTTHDGGSGAITMNVKALLRQTNGQKGGGWSAASNTYTDEDHRGGGWYGWSQYSSAGWCQDYGTGNEWFGIGNSHEGGAQPR